MSDMSAVIVAKSDQLNGDDLLSGPRTIRITGVNIKPGTEQPVAISFDGDEGKPWKPCKTCSRVLVGAWGPDAKAYVGRSLRIYRDPDVTWGGMKVGGIRISHMSDIERELSMALMASNKKKGIVTIKPLANAPTPAAEPDTATKWANAYLAKLPTLTTPEALETFAKSKAAKLEELRTARPELHQQVSFGLEQRRSELAPKSSFDDDFGDDTATADNPAAAEGRAESDMGEGFTDDEPNPNRVKAEKWIDGYRQRIAATSTVEELERVHTTANIAAADLRREFPALYLERLSSLRPDDAPEKSRDALFETE